MDEPKMTYEELLDRHDRRSAEKQPSRLAETWNSLGRKGKAALAVLAIAATGVAVESTVSALDRDKFCVVERIIPNDSQAGLLKAVKADKGEYVSHIEVPHEQTPSGAFIVEGEWCGNGPDPLDESTSASSL